MGSLISDSCRKEETTADCQRIPDVLITGKRRFLEMILAKVKKFLLKQMGKVGMTQYELSLDHALGRCRKRNLRVGTVIDVGASDGRWSLSARKHFPQASFFLVEAQDAHAETLLKLKDAQPQFDFVISAAGDRNGTIYFDAGDLFGGVASDTPLEQNCITVPVVTIDSQVRERGLTPPFLLKLDTHGFEVPIFEGARETLKNTALIVVEVYNFQLTGTSLRFHEMCAYLENLGFRCIDLSEPMHRPGDGALWQMDLFFIPADNGTFTHNIYEWTPDKA